MVNRMIAMSILLVASADCLSDASFMCTTEQVLELSNREGVTTPGTFHLTTFDPVNKYYVDFPSQFSIEKLGVSPDQLVVVNNQDPRNDNLQAIPMAQCQVFEDRIRCTNDPSIAELDSVFAIELETLKFSFYQPRHYHMASTPEKWINGATLTTGSCVSSSD